MRFGWGMVGARVVVGGLYENPKAFVGRVVALWFSGNSLGFRGLCCFGVDYCTLENLECAILWVCGGAVNGYGETFAPFAVVELGEVVLHGWKLGFYRLRELNRLFGIGGNLGGSFACVETLVCGALRNLEWASRDRWKLRGGFLRAWELGLLAQTKLSVCIRGLRETSWLSWVRWNFGRVRWWFHVVRWSVCVVRWSGVVVGWSFFFSAFRGTRWLL